MKIKAIEVVGFKSFFEKTSLAFFPGITAMVGPNGCGKSNIVDAIRWAMGEQSAKHLRGTLMEDVIFNGSKSKKPLGMAEVSLTFSNENGNTPLLYKDFTEIQITRRLFRSGESEYYINKAPCRLKDITELFMDTGVGTKAYSIIEQGRVDTIISAKPIEIRSLIEEAAGISKYKVRKQEALRKMEATRQNLLRINDVLREIKKQISSLAYQAQKLKRFKGLKERIRTLELASNSQKYTTLYGYYTQKKTELESLKDKQSLLMTEMNSFEAAIVSKKTHLQEYEEKYTTTQGKSLEIKYALREEENNIERHRERISDLEKISHKATQEIEEHLDRLRLEEGEVSTSKALKTELQEKASEAEGKLKEEEENLSEVKRNFVSIQKDLEHQRESLFNVRYEIGRRGNIISQEEKTGSECRRRLEQNWEEVRRTQSQLEEAKRQEVKLNEILEKNRQEKDLLEKEQDTHENVIALLNKDANEITAALAEFKEKQARCESQREALQELCNNFEGCSEGVRAIMQRKKGQKAEENGIHGLVADFVETEPSLEKAVEAVLGDKLQYIVVKSQAEGVEAIEYLKSQSLGRGTFVPVETERFSVLEDTKDTSSGYHATPLIHKVKIREGYFPIVRYLLGDALLVENFLQAIELWKDNKSKNTLVTQDGEVIDPMGIITGGIHNGSGTGYLNKKREIKELEQRLFSLAHELSDLQKRKAIVTNELNDKEHSLKRVREKLVQQKLSLQNLERDLRQTTEELQRFQQKLEFLVLEKEKLTSELVELEEDLEMNRSDLETLESNQALLEESFSRLQEKEKEYREKIELQVKCFDHDKMELMDLKAQISSLTSTLTLREKTLVNCRTEISKCKQAKEEAEQESGELRENIETALTRIHDLSQVYQHYQDELGEQERVLNEERDSLQNLEEKLKADQKEFNTLQLSIQDLGHELSELRSKMQYLEDAMMTKYHVSLSEVAGQYPPEDYPEEEIKTKLEKLERAREKMIEGINFNAEREYEEQMEKYQFYQTQTEDLNTSLHSLQEAIGRINRTSRERFQTAFQKINENFQGIVPLIYEGGKGELNLTDEDDLLETGVEIMVQPAGKSLKSITLLSGGEKALAAISLLFSLYLFKPTPFCLLDEVDSPLDDANVDRFVTILKKFTPDSQFILVTHNKKTMETADILYGITMEEPGVSKIVSVRLN
ncbi:MAG: chromosome segregation protein SMC [Pseudomonadota bacterium]